MSRRVLVICDWCEHREERLTEADEDDVPEPWFFVVGPGPEASWEFCSAECLKSYDFPI